jgi:hypothetical protein
MEGDSPYRRISKRDHRLVLVLIGVCLGCGGSPSAPSPPPPPPFLGEWSGLIDISYQHPLIGETRHDICDHQWTVQTQAGTAFSGMFRAAGGTALFPRGEPCLDSGAFSGSVSSSGQVTALTYGPALLGGASVNRDCSVVTRAVLAGITNGLSLAAEGSDVMECLVAGSPTRISRSLVLRLTKRSLGVP